MADDFSLLRFIAGSSRFYRVTVTPPSCNFPSSPSSRRALTALSEDHVGVRDNGGTMRPPEQSGSPPAYYPVVIPVRYTSADTSGISVAAAADSKPVTIAIEKK